jgi:hypothetical protein
MQAQFSQMLGFEASRVAGLQSKLAAAAAPAHAAPAEPRKKIEGYERITMAQKLVVDGHV